jgi:hypothetical protein
MRVADTGRVSATSAGRWVLARLLTVHHRTTHKRKAASTQFRCQPPSESGSQSATLRSPPDTHSPSSVSLSCART